MTGFALLIGALGALSLTVTKIVDFVRNALDPTTPGQTEPPKYPKATWNILALVVGLAFALGWQINLVGQATALVPALASSTRLAGVAGQVLTGLVIGGGSGFFHELLSALSSIQTKNVRA